MNENRASGSNKGVVCHQDQPEIEASMSMVDLSKPPPPVVRADMLEESVHLLAWPLQTCKEHG